MESFLLNHTDNSLSTHHNIHRPQQRCSAEPWPDSRIGFTITHTDTHTHTDFQKSLLVVEESKPQLSLRNSGNSKFPPEVWDALSTHLHTDTNHISMALSTISFVSHHTLLHRATRTTHTHTRIHTYDFKYFKCLDLWVALYNRCLA